MVPKARCGLSPADVSATTVFSTPRSTSPGSSVNFSCMVQVSVSSFQVSSSLQLSCTSGRVWFHHCPEQTWLERTSCLDEGIQACLLSLEAFRPVSLNTQAFAVGRLRRGSRRPAGEGPPLEGPGLVLVLASVHLLFVG